MFEEAENMFPSDNYSVDEELSSQERFEEEETERQDAIIVELAERIIEKDERVKAAYESLDGSVKALIFSALKSGIIGAIEEYSVTI